MFIPEAVETGHLILAFALHLFVILSADHEFRMIVPTEFSELMLLAGSLLAFYLYATNVKTYDIFSFEAAYARIGGDFAVLQMDRTVEFYNQVLQDFAKKYRGIKFRWKLVEKARIRHSSIDKFKHAFMENFMKDSFEQLENSRFLSN